MKNKFATLLIVFAIALLSVPSYASDKAPPGIEFACFTSSHNDCVTVSNPAIQSTHCVDAYGIVTTDVTFSDVYAEMEKPVDRYSILKTSKADLIIDKYGNVADSHNRYRCVGGTVLFDTGDIYIGEPIHQSLRC